MTERDVGFTEFVSVRSSSLLRTARLLAKDMPAAEDLLQTALAKTYVVWNRVGEAGAERYLRRCLVTAAIDESRRPWRREHAAATLPDRAAPAYADGDPDRRLVLLDALGALPPQQRAAVVLRHYLDVSVAEAAELLRCSEGTVKSNASRGLARLRLVLQQTRGEL